MIFRILYESVAQALGQLNANRLRSFLSLMGITIGIWCVIMVLSAVHSLENNIRQSFDKLGDDVVYVGVMPWGEDPRENFWKYMRRPDPSYKDFKAIERKVSTSSMAAFSLFIGQKVMEYRDNSVSRVFTIGTTYEYKDIFQIVIDQGRYFSPTEYHFGANQVIIGYKVAEGLFPTGINPIGKTVKLGGRNMQVIGVIAKEGKDLINPVNFDEVALISYNAARSFVNTRNFRGPGGSIMVKAAEGVGLAELKDDLTGVLRTQRKLKPSEEDNFALNTLSVVSGALNSIFSVINVAGVSIGMFSLLVGGFGVANIMFVSVRERTNIIGIKKALGAKRYVILLEFLIEAILLCVIGGLIGLSLVYLGAKLGSDLADFPITLSQSDTTLGLGISIGIGIIFGLLPAWQAANLDPVEAMRR